MSIFGITPEVLEQGPKTFDKTKKALEEDVEIIRKWLHTQKHLPEVMDDVRIRNFLTLNKCSIERAKPKIDMYYTYRGLMPDLYKNASPSSEVQKKFRDVYTWLVVPQLTPDLYRVLIFNIDKPERADDVNVEDAVPFVFNLWELRLAADYMVGDICVVDMEHVTFSLMIKWTPSILGKIVSIYEKVYSTPLKGIYMFNCPTFTTHLMTIFKAIMKPKLFERIHVFTEGPEALKKHLPAECVPEDYGGQAKSIKELKKMLYEEFDRNQSRFDELDKFKVDESLRPEKLENSDVLGYHGSFKRLDLD